MLERRTKWVRLSLKRIIAWWVPLNPLDLSGCTVSVADEEMVLFLCPQTYYDSMRRPYYHNAGTGQTVWEMPPEMKAAQAAMGVGPPAFAR